MYIYIYTHGCTYIFTERDVVLPRRLPLNMSSTLACNHLGNVWADAASEHAGKGSSNVWNATSKQRQHGMEEDSATAVLLGAPARACARVCVCARVRLVLNSMPC